MGQNRADQIVLIKTRLVFKDRINRVDAHDSSEKPGTGVRANKDDVQLSCTVVDGLYKRPSVV